MKHFRMSDRKDKPASKSDKQSRASDSAFDMWLKRGLHELFDDIAKEPIPEELLNIIEQDRKN